MAGKIKSFEIKKKPRSGIVWWFPTDWVKDMDLQAGDKIDIYRDEEDRLILVANKQEQEKEKVEVGK